MKHHYLIIAWVYFGMLLHSAPVSATPPDCCIPIAAVALTEPMYFDFDRFECCCGPNPGDCSEHIGAGAAVTARYSAYSFIYACGHGVECADPASGSIPCGEVGPGTHLEWDGFIAGDFICEIGCEAPCFPQPPSQSFDVLDYFCDCESLECAEE